MKRFNYKGQSSLEIAISFGVLILFLVGMLRIFFWGNNTMLERQKNYISSRSRDGIWPLPATTPLSDTRLFH